MKARKISRKVFWSRSFSLTRLSSRVEQLSVQTVLLLVFLTITAHWVKAENLRSESWPEYPNPTVAGANDYSEAQELLAKKKWAEAAIVFRSILRKTPDYSPAAAGLTRALAFSGRREEALSFLWRFVDREKGARRSVLIRRGRVLSRQFLTSVTFQTYQDGLNFIEAKKYRLARERFEKALTQEPDNVEILTRLGQCLTLDNDFDSAAERLRLAKRLNPYEPEIRLWLGRTMHQRGEIKEAVDELKVAASELEGSEIAPIWLASALFSLGQKAPAIQVLEEDVKGQPYHLASLLSLARFRTQVTARDSQNLWAAKKDLQLALSRLDQYKVADSHKFEGELGLNIRNSAEEIKSESQKLLQQIEDRLEQGSGSG